MKGLVRALFGLMLLGVFANALVLVDDSGSGGSGGGPGGCSLVGSSPMLTYVEDNLDNLGNGVRNPYTFFGPVNSSFNDTPGGPLELTPAQTSVLAPAGGLACDGTINYNGKGTTVTKEEQHVYLFGHTSYDSTVKKVMGKNAKTGYEIVFNDPVPLCLDTTRDFLTCYDSDLVTKNHVHVTFLGDSYSILDAATGFNGIVNSVVLGKDLITKDILRVGDSIGTPDGYTVTLVDISGFGYGNGTNSTPRVSFDIADSNGNVIKQITTDENTPYLSVSEANNLVIKVNKVFPGAFAKVAYADVSFFSNAITLVNGQTVSNGMVNSKGWKALIQSKFVGASQGIWKIQLYNDLDQTYKSPISQDLAPGESIGIIQIQPGFQFNYLGMNAVNYDTLTVTVQKDMVLPYSGTQVRGDFLLVSSGLSNAFRLARNVSSVYVLVNNTNHAPFVSVGQAFYYDDLSGFYISNTSSTNQTPLNVFGVGKGVNYYLNPGSNNIEGGLISGGFAGANGVGLYIYELTEPVTPYTVLSHWNLLYDSSLRQFVNVLGATAADKIGYDNLMAPEANPPHFATQPPGFVSSRGSVFNGISSASASIYYARSLATASYTLTKVNVTPPNQTNPGYDTFGEVWLPQLSLSLDSGTVTGDMAQVSTTSTNGFRFSSPSLSTNFFFVDFSGDPYRSGHFYAYNPASGYFHDYGFAPINYVFSDKSTDTLTVTGQYNAHLGGMSDATGNMVTLKSAYSRAFRSVIWSKETDVVHLGLTGTAAGNVYYEEHTGTGIPINEWPENYNVLKYYSPQNYVPAPPFVTQGGPFSGSRATAIPVSGQAQSKGAISSLAWSVQSGPSGCTLNANPTGLGTPLAAIAGTAYCTVAGTYNIGLTATDNFGQKATAFTSLTVTAPAVGGGGSPLMAARVKAKIVAMDEQASSGFLLASSAVDSLESEAADLPSDTRPVYLQYAAQLRAKLGAAPQAVLIAAQTARADVKTQLAAASQYQLGVLFAGLFVVALASAWYFHGKRSMRMNARTSRHSRNRGARKFRRR